MFLVLCFFFGEKKGRDEDEDEDEEKRKEKEIDLPCCLLFVDKSTQVCMKVANI